MSKPKAPPAPDYVGAAKEQGVANLEAARATSKLSNPEWDNAEGSRRIIYGVDGDPDRVRVVDTMSPEAARQYAIMQGINTNLLNTAASGLDRVSAQMANQFDMSRVPDMPNAPKTDPRMRERYASALMSRLDPQFVRDEESARTRLATQGITQGSEAWNREMERLTQARNDARMQADIQAGQEQSRDLADQGSAYQLGMGGRQQAIQEQAYLRSLPLSEINALRTGSMPNMPQFQTFSGSNVQAAPLLQGVELGEQAALDRYNAKVSRGNAALGLLGQLGGGYMMMSGMKGFAK